MKVILSPAKNMKMRTFENIPLKAPIFQKEIAKIHNTVKNIQPFELESLMKINKEIALKSFCYFQDFNLENKGGHALLCYDGLVYKNINASDFTNSDIDFANKHLRIISGFYGVLSPCTNILPYRLEMQCKLDIDSNVNLYNFWGNKIYNEILKNSNIIINLASKEYYSTIIPFLTKDIKFITIDFLVNKNDKHKIIATSAKIARGQMARFIIKNKISDVNDIKDFEFDNFKFNEYLSNEKKFIFLK